MSTSIDRLAPYDSAVSAAPPTNCPIRPEPRIDRRHRRHRQKPSKSDAHKTPTNHPQSGTCGQSEVANAGRLSTLAELTASIAHEVNQPLSAILTNGETGLRWLNRSEPNLAKALDMMRRIVIDAHRASAIVARIRSIATGVPSQRTALALDDIIADSLAAVQREVLSTKVIVLLDLALALPPIHGDRTQLQQVIVNLMMNAVQALAQSDAANRTVIIRTMQPDRESVCFVIEDSGAGIDPTHLPYLFNSFFTTKKRGMGMGLSVSQFIVKAHGGHIRADNNSSLGGARFSLVLPAHLAPSSRATCAFL